MSAQRGRVKMAKRLLLLSDENQLHKCHLNENEPKNIQVGNEWSQNITFLNLENPIFIEWNGEYCQMGDQSLSMNEHLTFNHGGQSDPSLFDRRKRVAAI